MSRRQRRRERQSAQITPCPCCGQELYLQEEISGPFPCPFCGNDLNWNRLPAICMSSNDIETSQNHLIAAEVFHTSPSQTHCAEPPGYFLIDSGEERPCPNCNTSLDIFPDLEELFCPHCSVSLRVANHSRARTPSTILLPCPSCRLPLEFEQEIGTESFPCPHCEHLLLLQSPDFYRQGSPRLEIIFCFCGGPLRLSKIIETQEPLAGVEAALGLGATSVPALLIKGGVPQSLAFWGKAVHSYRCFQCGQRMEIPFG